MGLSEIGNKALLRRIAEVLTILDVKQFPSMLDTSACGVTIEIGQFLGGIIKELPSYVVSSGADVVDISTMPLYKVSSMPGAGEDEDGKLMAFSFRVSGGPDAGVQNIRIRMFYEIEETEINVFDYTNWDLTQTGSDWSYGFAMGGMNSGGNEVTATAKPSGVTWNGFVPAGCALSFEISTLEGTGFPAGSSFQYEWVFINDAKGNLIK